jgi:glycine/D-amino acid oxidase-like deaminating enzyme
LWRQLAATLPPDAEYTPLGTLWVAADDEELQEICRKHSVYQKAGIPSELIDPQSLARIEPALRPGLTGALLMPEDVVVSPQPAARFLLQQASATLVREKATAMGQSNTL